MGNEALKKSGVCESSVCSVTEQQARFSPARGGKLQTYMQLVVGDRGFFEFLGFELYNLVLSAFPTAAGIFLRSKILPFFLKESSTKIALGRNVLIRVPSRITMKAGVILDDFSTLDVRVSNSNIPSGIFLGENVSLGRFSSIVSKDGVIEIGSGSNVSSHCRIATQSKISIGKSVLVAAYSYIGPGNHKFDDASRPIMEQGMEESRGVVIGDNAWVGAHSTILDGVTIGENAIIGAHSLVTSDIPPGAIAAGVPAKVIKLRS